MVNIPPSFISRTFLSDLDSMRTIGERTTVLHPPVAAQQLVQGGGGIMRQTHPSYLLQSPLTTSSPSISTSASRTFASALQSSSPSTPPLPPPLPQNMSAALSGGGGGKMIAHTHTHVATAPI